MPTILPNDLRSFATALLTAGGFSPDDAAQTADLLVWANLRGVDSHGVLRIPRYIEMVELGVISSGGTIETIKQFGAVTVLDGGKCPGSVGMNAAVGHAASLAEKLGIGWCSARNISHAGAVGYFTTALANKGYVGIAMTASKPLMSYFGAKGEVLSTNPLSIAFPASNGQDPIVLDMSTAAVALGKILAAKDAGKDIPEGWGVDANGDDTTDPHKVAAVLPMAGPKGSGLSLMIEMLASVLAGNAIIGPVLTNKKKGGFNGLVMAINPEAFGDIEDFASEVSLLNNAISNLDPVPGIEKVLLPGGRGFATNRHRSTNGIPLAAGTVSRLAKTALQFGIDLPKSLT